MVECHLCKVEVERSSRFRSIMNNYTPGSAYREGYADRMSGKPNKFKKYPDLDHSPVAEEYQAGYNDAHDAILRDARGGRIQREGFIQD